MKKLFFMCMFVLLSLAIGGNADAQNGSPAPSVLCPHVGGITGVFWDLENGILRGDLPGGLPTIETVGGTFHSSRNPFLFFNYPVNYTATEVLSEGSLGGVVVIRNDNQVIWKDELISTSTEPDIDGIRDWQVNSVLQFLGLQGNEVQTICAQEHVSEVAPGTNIFSITSARLIQVGTHTTFVSVSSISAPGLLQIRIRAAAGPSAEFEQLITSTFLAIEVQLLVTGFGNPY